MIVRHVLGAAAALAFLVACDKPAPAPLPAGNRALEVKSTPAGARVLVDGVDRGATPLRLPIAPGRYRVELRLSGYLPQQADTTVGFAEDAKLDVALVASH